VNPFHYQRVETPGKFVLSNYSLRKVCIVEVVEVFRFVFAPRRN
jgi:hypothetical protein